MQNAHISALQTKHADLDARISEENTRPHPDYATLARLKKEKLKVKEAIVGIVVLLIALIERREAGLRELRDRDQGLDRDDPAQLGRLAGSTTRTIGAVAFHAILTS